MDGTRRRFKDSKYGISFIELKPDDGQIGISFLEIDNRIFKNPKDIFKNEQIFLLHYYIRK